MLIQVYYEKNIYNKYAFNTKLFGYKHFPNIARTINSTRNINYPHLFSGMRYNQVLILSINTLNGTELLDHQWESPQYLLYDFRPHINIITLILLLLAVCTYKKAKMSYRRWWRHRYLWSKWSGNFETFRNLSKLNLVL